MYRYRYVTGLEGTGTDSFFSPRNRYGYQYSMCHPLIFSLTNCLAPGFFHESSFPKSLKRTLGSFRIFSKIRGDIHKSRCTTVINYTGGKFAIGTSGVVDTSGT
jgi:hypothetical protein